jgi:hypothetical protein
MTVYSVENFNDVQRRLDIRPISSPEVRENTGLFALSPVKPRRYGGEAQRPPRSFRRNSARAFSFGSNQSEGLLTRFLPANRYAPTIQARGRLSPESAMEIKDPSGGTTGRVKAIWGAWGGWALAPDIADGEGLPLPHLLVARASPTFKMFSDFSNSFFGGAAARVGGFAAENHREAG